MRIFPVFSGANQQQGTSHDDPNDQVAKPLLPKRKTTPEVLSQQVKRKEVLKGPLANLESDQEYWDRLNKSSTRIWTQTQPDIEPAAPPESESKSTLGRENAWGDKRLSEPASPIEFSSWFTPRAAFREGLPPDTELAAAAGRSHSPSGISLYHLNISKSTSFHASEASSCDLTPKDVSSYSSAAASYLRRSRR